MDIGVVRMRNKDLVAIETDHGYTVFDIEDGSEVDVGDIITGRLDNHGSETVNNATKKQTLSVYIEAIRATQRSAVSLLQSI
jgi:hypothetical protein